MRHEGLSAAKKARLAYLTDLMLAAAESGRVTAAMSDEEILARAQGWLEVKGWVEALEKEVEELWASAPPLPELELSAVA
jgi:hypothetical protein